MANVKVSQLPELTPGLLDINEDWLFLSDLDAAVSKKMKPVELIKAILPYADTRFDFSTGSLPSTVDFTRASTGWRTNSSGVFVPETTDAPRFQHDPVTLAPRGLLIENQATNLIRQSADITTSWAATRSTRTANAAVAPDGAMAMDRLTEDTSVTDNHFVQSASFSTTNGDYYAMSVYAKAETRSWLYVMPISNFVAFTRAWFNVGAGVAAVGSMNGGVVASYIEHVGNDIYRCTIIAPATATAGTSELRVGLATGDGVTNYTGDGTSGLLLWGAEVKGSAYVSTHIPTTTAAVARAGDVALITNPMVLTDRCWVIKGRTPRRFDDGTTPVIFQVDDGSGANRLLIRYSGSNSLNVIATVNGATQCNMVSGTVDLDTDFTIAVRWADNDFAVSLNGGAVVTDISGAVPTGLTTARIGRGQSGNFWNSTIRYIETLRSATDAELILLSQ